MLVALASHSRQDEPTTSTGTGTRVIFYSSRSNMVSLSLSADDSTHSLSVEECILNHVLRLLKKEMPDNVKMLAQYFQFFVNYSSMGRHEVGKQRAMEVNASSPSVPFVYSVSN